MSFFISTYFSNKLEYTCHRGIRIMPKSFSGILRCLKGTFLFLGKYVAMLFLLIAVSLNSFSQTVSLPSPINVINVNPIGSGLGSESQRENVGKGVEMEFSVSAVIDDVGSPENNEFHWIVYGGTIEAVTGGTISGAVNKYSDVGNELSDVLAKGWTNGASSIKIKWQANECANAFIAVKQTSEYGCSDDVYSIYYVNVINKNIDLEVVPQIDACAKAKDNFVSFDMTILNAKLDDKWKFSYELRTRDSDGSWSEWVKGTTATVQNTGDPDYGYVVISAGSDNTKYTLNIPISDNNRIRGTGDYFTEIRITDVRDAYNCTLETLPGKNATVTIHKIPKTDFGITSDD